MRILSATQVASVQSQFEFRGMSHGQWQELIAGIKLAMRAEACVTAVTETVVCRVACKVPAINGFSLQERIGRNLRSNLLRLVR